MIQTGSATLDALIAELESQCLTLLEANASKAAEIAALKEEKAKLEKQLASLQPEREQPLEPT